MRDHRSTLFRQIVEAICLSVVCFAAARIAIYFLIQPQGMAPFWFSNGVALAVLLRRPKVEWPLLLVGCLAGFSVNMYLTEYPAYPSLVYGIANDVEILLAALLIGKFYPRFELNNFFSLGLLIFASLIASMIGATIAWAVGPINWKLWFIDDWLGTLLATPTLLVFWPYSSRYLQFSRPKMSAVLEMGLILVSMVFVVIISLLKFDHTASFLFSYMPLPFLLWATLRYKTAGATIASLLLAMIIIGIAIYGVGPLAKDYSEVLDRSLLVQTYLAIVLLTQLSLAVSLEQKERYETQLRVAQRLEGIGTLARGVAHDFNNITTAILGNLAIIKSRLPKDVAANPYLENKFDLIESAGMRSKALVQQILTFSRQTSSRKEPVQLKSIVEETVTLLKANLPANTTIHTQVEEEEWPILGDASQIHQVVFNLVNNSLQALKMGGTIDVSLEPETLDYELQAYDTEAKPGLYMKLSVKDSGEGISNEALPHIFEPFFTTKPAGKGTGLGLSVVHGIVKNHCGAITVDSKVGQGTTIDIFFPT